MTPESVLKALAEALAKKYTTSGRYEDEDARLDDRIDRGMMKTFVAGDGHLSIRAVTPREAAVEAMSVVGPLLELVFEMKGALESLAKSHKEFIEEWARHDADASTLEVQHVAESLVREVEIEEPADWPYLNQFSATPNEIHDILRHGLHPNVHLAYQQALGRAIVQQAAEDVLDIEHHEYDLPGSQSGRQQAAAKIRSGVYPKEVVHPEG